MSDLLDLLDALHMTDRQTAARATRLPQQFAAKWLAETVGREPPRPAEPTDEALAEAFKHCARPAPAKWYPAIREAIATGEATG